MSIFHRRCQAQEAFLVARLTDVEAENQRLREALIQASTEYAERLLVLANPAAARHLQAVEPRSPERDQSLPAPPRPAIARLMAPSRPKRGPVVPFNTPVQSGFRPPVSSERLAPAGRPSATTAQSAAALVDEVLARNAEPVEGDAPADDQKE